MKGGNTRAVIPFIKKMGLVSSDGTPTNRYREFRNPNKSGVAIADSMRELYEVLFEMNEYAYELDPSELKGLIVEATGAEMSSTVVQKTLSTFTALKKRADFEEEDSFSKVTPTVIEPYGEQQERERTVHQYVPSESQREKDSINLSYTINLNLPVTTDIEVFNAIFKSMKQHLIQE